MRPSSQTTLLGKGVRTDLMFHCNGWCFPWTMALIAGASVFLRKVAPTHIFELVREHQITHLRGAPLVYSLLISTPDALRAGLEPRLDGQLGGAAPAAAVLAGWARVRGARSRAAEPGASP